MARGAFFGATSRTASAALGMRSCDTFGRPPRRSCDTFVIVGPELTVFGKNSDRPAEEEHEVVYVGPRRQFIKIYYKFLKITRNLLKITRNLLKNT